MKIRWTYLDFAIILQDRIIGGRFGRISSIFVNEADGVEVVAFACLLETIAKTKATFNRHLEEWSKGAHVTAYEVLSRSCSRGKHF